MSTKKQDLTPIAKRRTKLIYEAKQEEPDDREILFQSSVLCHCYLPRREPDQAPNEIWQTESGKFSLYVMPMPIRNPATHEMQYLGLPYGVKARIILATLNTIALKTQNRVIDMPAGSVTEFNSLMGFSEGGSQVSAVRDQISRMASCVIRMTYDGQDGQQNINMPLVSGFTLFPDKHPDQLMLWPSEIELSELYFNNLMEHAVPLAKSHLTALSNNATAIDWYTFLAHRLHRIPANKPQFLGWQTIKEQFGGDYTRMVDFRANFKKVHRLVKSLYTDARVEEKGTRGLTLHFSQTPIPKRLIVSGLDEKL
ncbi:replication protein RepA [Spirosoma lituiforme]